MKPRITPSTRTGLLPLVGLAMALWLAITGNVQAARIKEVASIEGVRSNQLTGFGLVVGLDGTGDQTTQMPYTTQGLSNYLKQLGLTLPTAQLAQLQMKNVAAVLVTAQLPAFARPGQTLDINVSSLGNSKSLKGGTLIGTPLKGADGEVYAFAQGNLIVAGAGAAAGGSKVTVNHLSVGRIPDGAQVERSVPTALQEGPTVSLSLNATDFQTAHRVAQAINRKFGEGVAQALDGRTVQVNAPVNPNDRVTFLAEMEELPVQSSIAAAKVIINSRTGSIVLNQAVTLGPCAIAHGNLTVTISSTPIISQPNALSIGGQTVVTEKANKADSVARGHQTGRRGQGAELAGRYAAGFASHIASHQSRWRAERGTGSDLT
jgi:flagellar P-ring protein precursor FlgI